MRCIHEISDALVGALVVALVVVFLLTLEAPVACMVVWMMPGEALSKRAQTFLDSLTP